MSQVPFELAVERFIDASPETIFRVWRERLEEWWCPKPWTTKLVEMDLRPGGRSAMVMSGPNGETQPIEGVILEVVPNRSIVFTDAFSVGWVPQAAFMVGFFQFTPEGKGTRYRAGARHWNEAAMQEHEAVGFREGWKAVADQLAELAEAEQRPRQSPWARLGPGAAARSKRGLTRPRQSRIAALCSPSCWSCCSPCSADARRARAARIRNPRR